MLRPFLLLGSLLVIIEINNSACSQSYTNITSPKKVATEKISADTDLIICGIGWGPQYPGGDIAIYKFITEHLRYPETAFKQKISGSVIVQFKVDTFGNIKDINIVYSTNRVFDKEATRVIGLLHGWKFSEDAAGRKREAYLKQPFTFKIPEEIKKKHTKKLAATKKIKPYIETAVLLSDF